MTKPTKPDLPEDPSGIEEPHDTLAAEEFAIPSRPASSVPHDPSGIRKPHDVLAADEFAMPGAGYEPSSGGIDPRTLLPGVLILLAIAFLFARRRRNRP